MNKPHQNQAALPLSAFMVIMIVLLLFLVSCSQKSDLPIYGKWQLTRTAAFDANGAQVMASEGGKKVIEFRKDGSYFEGDRPGKFEFADTNLVNIRIDGLGGTARIVFKDDTLEIWNPDGSQMDSYKRKN